jgi:hypothetical protein
MQRGEKKVITTSKFAATDIETITTTSYHKLDTTTSLAM